MPTALPPDRTRRAAVAVLIAMAIAFLVTVAAGSGSEGAVRRLGGDFPAFYAAGTIVDAGDGADLYDAQRQAGEQRGLFGDDSSPGFLYFAYPPYVALPYAALAALPYRAAYAVHTLLMVACLAVALWLLRPLLPVLDRRYPEVLAAATLFAPMNEALRGGQNTALSLLLIVASWRLVAAHRFGLAGVVLGLFAMKPQLAALFIVYFLVAKSWRVVVGLVPTVVVLWATGVAVSGASWPSAWLDSTRALYDFEGHTNGHSTVSLLGGADQLFGLASTTARVVGVAVALPTALLLMSLWFRVRQSRQTLAVGVAATTAAALLLSLHAQSSEAGLLVLVGVVLVGRVPHWVLGTLFAVAYLHVPTAHAGLTVLLPITAAAFALCVLGADVTPENVHHEQLSV
jgi:hypothetical protein